MEGALQLKNLQYVWEGFLALVGSIGISDILDIAIVAFLVYKLIGLIRDTRANQLVKGVIVILVVYLLADVFQLKVLVTIIKFLLTYGVIGLIVLFQPELRKLLEQVGRTTLNSFQFFSSPQQQREQKKKEVLDLVTNVVDACEIMSQEKTGALIVIERQTKIGDIIATGTTINADPKEQLIRNIFFKNSPLHDGALVIRDGRLFAAGCFLPLSQNYGISKALGTRHRAALGISEVCDAIVVICSEETGHISYTLEGEIHTDVPAAQLKTILCKYLMPQEDKVEIRKLKLELAKLKRKEKKDTEASAEK